MNHDSLQTFLGFVTQQIDSGNRISPIVWGSTGVGKTQAVERFARSIQAECVVLHLASQDPGDLIGLPSRDEETGTTKWLRPEWMPAQDDDRRFVIFLDEFNRANRYVLDVMLPFLLDGTLGTHRVPENTVIIAASNPGGTEDYAVTEIEDKAMLSRLCHVALNAEFDGWKSHVQEEVHPSILEAVSVAKGDIFGRVDLPEVNADPRSLHIAGIALNALSPEQYEEFGFEFIRGMVGDLAGSICQHYEDRAKKKLPPEQIVFEYDRIRPVVLKSCESDIEVVQVAINECMDVLRAQINDHGLENATTRSAIDNIADFLIDVPSDLFMALVTQLSSSSTSDVTLSVELGKKDKVMERYSSIQHGGSQ